MNFTCPVDPAPAQAPRGAPLRGNSIRLERLASSHMEGLYRALCGFERDRLWTFMAMGPFADSAAFDSYFAPGVTADPFRYVVIDQSDDRVLGTLSLMRIDLPNRVIEVGFVIYAPELQRSRAATEAQYLLARHIFEDLGFRRYEWKCDAVNAASRNAAERLGFTYEGVFRQHMIVKGRNRDTAWFAMLDHEWPARRAAFEAWLAPENFDAQGQQKRALSTMNR
jgi:RimJ/RimL family protein N-acetyltransferase